MHPFRSFLAIVICAGVFASPAFGTRTHKSSATTSRTHHRSSHRGSSAHSKSYRQRGQQSIDSSRVTQIQQALIREHYLTGEPAGTWNQANQGWQTKLMPDSRALKKLGLGPDYSNALNAKNSTFAAPPASGTIPADQAAGFTAASGVSQ